MAEAITNVPRIQIPNPNSHIWTGVRPGEFDGLIFSAKSIDLERYKGKVALADSYSNVGNSGVLTNLTTPIAYVRSSADNTDRWWKSGGRLFKSANSSSISGWSQDALANTPSAPLYDLIDFGGALLAPIATDISRLSAGVWTASWWQGTLAQPALTANAHRFFILAGALCITDGKLIQNYDGTIVGTALTLPTGFIAQGGLVSGEIAHIFGRQDGGGETYIYTWDRVASTYLAKYPVGDSEVFGGWVSDTVYIITKKGVIKKFNGNGYVPIDLGNGAVVQFPTVEAQQSITSIHPNGISVTENIVKILVNFGAISNVRLSSGIWNFDMKTGNLYHAGSVKNTSTKDFSQGELADVGAIKQTVVGDGLYLVGAQAYVSYPNTTIYGTFVSDEDGSANQGYIMTTKLLSTDVQRFWRKIFVTMRNMTSADDRFRIAIRTSDSNSLPAYETVTWLSASTFTASNSDIAAGDIVEVIAGDNAGAIARITSIVGTTVTIDRSLYASTNDARVRYLRFTDIGTISNVQVQTEVFYATQRGPFLQCLIEFRGSRTSPLLERLLYDFKELPQVV